MDEEWDLEWGWAENPRYLHPNFPWPEPSQKQPKKDKNCIGEDSDHPWQSAILDPRDLSSFLLDGGNKIKIQRACTMLVSRPNVVRAATWDTISFNTYIVRQAGAYHLQHWISDGR
jgi:hypothetical protein